MKRQQRRARASVIRRDTRAHLLGLVPTALVKLLRTTCRIFLRGRHTRRFPVIRIGRPIDASDVASLDDGD